MATKNNLECKICKKELTGRQRLFCCDLHQIQFNAKERTSMHLTVTRKEHGQNVNSIVFTKGILSVACQINLHHACKGMTKRLRKCGCKCHK